MSNIDSIQEQQIINLQNQINTISLTPGPTGPTGPAGGGSITLGAVGNTPNANAATLISDVLSLQPADESNPGIITAGPNLQIINGEKQFNDRVYFSRDPDTGTGAWINSGGSYDLSIYGGGGVYISGGGGIIECVENLYATGGIHLSADSSLPNWTEIVGTTFTGQNTITVPPKTGTMAVQNSTATTAAYTGATAGTATIKYVITGNQVVLNVYAINFTGATSNYIDIALPAEIDPVATFNFTYLATNGGVTAFSQGIVLSGPIIRLYYGTTGLFSSNGSISGFCISYCKFGF